jgi:hypothetical protein
MAVSTQKILDTGGRVAVVKITNDGATDESSAIVSKLLPATFVGAPSQLKILRLTAEVMPTTATVSVYYEGATDSLAWVLNSHSDTKDFSAFGPIPNDATTPTGNIGIQTSGANVIYSIILEVVPET